MYKITETYTDYNGNERTEDLYFNFTEAEVAHMQYSVEGGLAAKIQRVIDAHNTPELIEIFEDLLQKSYGRKSEDGRRFLKSKEILEDFVSTPAYSQIYMRLATDAKAAEDFVNNVIPKPKKQALDGPTETAPAVTGPVAVK